mmetsp:Transcript_50231/g.131476  ORF Transcript_50231/g.131476 Transcript_50231/m.131476 type:complete len:324 (+) Transcript_50231:247-1218(+)
MLRRLASLRIRRLPQLIFGHDLRLMGLEVPLAQDVSSTDLHQRVDRELLGVLPHLGTELEGGEDVLLANFGALLAVSAGIALACSLAERGPEASLLPLLEVLLNILIVVALPSLVNSGAAQCLHLGVCQLPTGVEAHVLPVAQAHHTKLYTLQLLRPALLSLEPLEELHSVVRRVAFAIGGDDHDDDLVLGELVRVEVLQVHDADAQVVLLGLGLQLLGEALSGAALRAEIDINVAVPGPRGLGRNAERLFRAGACVRLRGGGIVVVADAVSLPQVPRRGQTQKHPRRKLHEVLRLDAHGCHHVVSEPPRGGLGWPIGGCWQS